MLVFRGPRFLGSAVNDFGVQRLLVEPGEAAEDRTGSTAPAQMDGAIGRLSRMDAIERLEAQPDAVHCVQCAAEVGG